MTKPFKRVFVGGDTHCGSYFGLNPHPDSSISDKVYQTQKVCWEFFKEKVNKYKPYDIALWGGDLITGKNQKSGGRQVISHSLKDQCKIAVEVIKEVDCNKHRLHRGTPYHVAPTGDHWEDIIVEMLPDYNVQIRDHGFYKINGKNFDVKHKVSSSGIPHGRLTGLAKEILWAGMWHNNGVQPKPHVLIRHHVHYFEQILHDGCYGIIAPGLQGLGDEYGQMQCSGIVDFGFVVIDVYDDGTISIVPEIMKGFMQCSNNEVL